MLDAFCDFTEGVLLAVLQLETVIYLCLRIHGLPIPPFANWHISLDHCLSECLVLLSFLFFFLSFLPLLQLSLMLLFSFVLYIWLSCSRGMQHHTDSLLIKHFGLFIPLVI